MSYSPFSERITARLMAWRWPMLVLVFAAVAIAAGPARQLGFDRSIENMFAPDDPLLVPYRQLKRTFGGNEIALAAYDDPNLLTSVGMSRLDDLSRRLGQVAGVDAVMSLTTTPLGVAIVDDPLLEPFLHLFEGYMVSADRKTTAVVCMLSPEEDSSKRTATVNSLRSIISQHDPTGVVTGEPVMVSEGFRYLERDGDLLGWLSTGLLMLTIVLCFRSLRWVIVPIAVVTAALWLTKGVLVIGDFRLSMVSSMLWSIITVVGIANVMHIIVRYREDRGRGLSPPGALLATGGALAIPIFWVCLTDTAGFASLLTAKVGPVHDFGAMMAIGSALVLVCTAMMLPGLTLLGRIDTDPQWAWGEQNLDRGLHWIVGWLERRPKATFFASMLFVGVSLIGYVWLDVETDFTKNFRASSPVVKSYQFVESHLGGAGVLDVLLRAPEELNTAFLDRVRRLQQRLRDEVQVIGEDGRLRPGLTKVLSMTDAIDTFIGSLPKEMREAIPIDVMMQNFEQQMPVAMNSLLGRDEQQGGQRYYRIMLRAKERQPAAAKNEIIDQVRKITTEMFPDGASVTGFFVLLTNLIDSMIRDQWVSFGIATVSIWLMMTVAFRSVWLAAIAMIPNGLPILVVSGLMGWFGLRINMGAAMIAAVSMGLAVDASIHYIADFLEARRRGHTIYESIDMAHQSAGRAAVFATLSLVVGFSALWFSQFIPLVYFGALVGLTMVGGMLGNLILLPLLLRMWSGERL
jgi:predicted RND superfamily exporter protein